MNILHSVGSQDYQKLPIMTPVVAFDLPNYLSQCQEANQHTRDTPQLFKKEGHLVFLYDSYKRNFKNHSIISNCISLGVGYLRPKNYILYFHRETHIPVILSTGMEDELAGSIKGEVYILPPETLTFLDMVRENNVNYTRKKLTIDLSHPYPSEAQSLEAWVYEGIPQAYSSLTREGYLELGTRFVRKKNNYFKYYEFTKRDLVPKKEKNHEQMQYM